MTNIIIKERFSTTPKFQSKDYPEFEGTLKDEFIKFLIKKRTNLSGSDLRGSDLRGSNLSGSDLRGSDLRGSNLSNSNLSGSDFQIFSKWSIRYTLPNIIHIGCKTKTIKEWDNWFKNSDETFDHKRDSSIFKRIYAHYRAARSYLKECEKADLFQYIEVERNEQKQMEWQVK